ncbi:MAG: hypothetical protein P8Z81_00400 [Deinococcales bacterium]|jgi:hypothetical protein
MSTLPSHEAADDPAAWPEELDALKAAPDHHTLVLENERVRVLDTLIRAGDKTPVHTHRWPAIMVVLAWSPFVRYDEHGSVMVDSRQVPAMASPPSTLPSDPLPPHALENVGDGDIHIISVELKD